MDIPYCMAISMSLDDFGKIKRQLLSAYAGLSTIVPMAMIVLCGLTIQGLKRTKRHLVEGSGTRLNGAEEKVQTIGVVVIGLVIIRQTPFRLYFFVSEVLNDWNAELGMVTYLLFLANNLLNFPVYCAVFEGEKIMKNIKKITKYCAL